jgi:hypothetical protein
MQMTAREGTAAHRTGWVSKGDRLGCTGLRPVPSLRVRKGLECEGEPPMRPDPDVPNPDEGRNAWPSTALRDSCSSPGRRRS